MILILYILTIIVAYLILRYIVIKKKCGMTDEPQGVSLMIAFMWPFVLVVIIFFKLGEIIDNIIKSKVNGKV